MGDPLLIIGGVRGVLKVLNVREGKLQRVRSPVLLMRGQEMNYCLDEFRQIFQPEGLLTTQVEVFTMS